MTVAAELFAKAIDGDRRALARLLTLIERGGPPADEIADLAHPRSGHARLVGMTGSPGAGKSTLTGRLLAAIEARHQTAAVLAIDPSSPITGGAILGDRIRMDDLAGAGVFIRSMATRGHAGGLALAVPGALRLLDAAGFDVVIVETVGVGQIEVDVAGAADTTIVIVTPGWGDAIQANKAGLLEVADIFVVNKADRAGAADARRDLEYMLDLGARAEWRPPIVCTVATEGAGIDELMVAIDDHSRHLAASGELERRRQRRARAEVRSFLTRALGAQIDEVIAGSAALLADVDERRIAPVRAAGMLARTRWGNMDAAAPDRPGGSP